MGQTRPTDVMQAAEATTGPGTVEQVSIVYAWFPDVSDYRYMTQVRLRLAAADAMAAAFVGTSCIVIGAQTVRIFPATPSRDPMHRAAGSPRELQDHVDALASSAVQQAPRRAIQPQILEITTADRHGAQLGEVRPRSMRPDAWLPGHSTLRLYSAT
eukprot:2630816-Pyramimonas_sp.AAC.1